MASAIAVATLASLGAAQQPVPRVEPPDVEIRGALTALSDHYQTITAKMGSDQVLDLQERLDTDLGWMPDATPAPGYDQGQWQDRLALQAHLDSAIVTQAAAGASAPLAASAGLSEHLVVSRVDGKLAPYALYVPPGYARDVRLVVLLHGNPQTESELLSSRYFRALADETGTIIAAPYGRGIYDFAPPAGDEVYQVAEEVGAAFHVPPNRIYLAGYSMGGFSVFKIGRLRPQQWAAVMAIAGAAYGSEIDLVRQAFAHMQVFVITGTHDESIPTQYPQNTALYLSSVGVSTGLYIQPGGTHYLPTIWPMVSAAWHDMLAGKIRASAWPKGVANTQLGPPTTIDVPAGMRP